MATALAGFNWSHGLGASIRLYVGVGHVFLKERDLEVLAGNEFQPLAIPFFGHEAAGPYGYDRVGCQRRRVPLFRGSDSEWCIRVFSRRRERQKTVGCVGEWWSGLGI
jgi:hypothetical protein